MFDRRAARMLALAGVVAVIISASALLAWVGSGSAPVQAVPPQQVGDSTPTPTPTLTPTPSPEPISLGATTRYVEPALLGKLVKHSRGETVETELTVRIPVDDEAIAERTESNTLEEDVTAKGGTSNGSGSYTLPVGQVLPVLQRSDVVEMYLVQAFALSTVASDFLLGGISDVSSAYTDGTSAGSAAKYAMFIKDDKVLSVLFAGTASTATGVRQWLSNRSVYVPPASATPTL